MNYIYFIIFFQFIRHSSKTYKLLIYITQLREKKK